MPGKARFCDRLSAFSLVAALLTLVFLLPLGLGVGDAEVSRIRNLQCFEMTPSMHPPGNASVSRQRNLQAFEMTPQVHPPGDACITRTRNLQAFEMMLFHDAAVADVHSTKKGCLPTPTVCRTMPLDIYLIAVNPGDFRETFNVTAYMGTMEIGTQLVALDSRQNISLIFHIPAINMSEYQSFTLRAYAWPIQNETNSADNTMNGESVTVVHMGDVTGDGKVDIGDVARVSGAFGSLRVSDSSDPQYGKYRHTVPCVTCPHEPNTDITGDAKVDIQDLARTSANFGWHR